MAMNRLQFQAGLSMAACFERYGTEPLCTAALRIASSIAVPEGVSVQRSPPSSVATCRDGVPAYEACADGPVPRHLPDRQSQAGAALALKRHLGVSYPTARLIHHKVMQALAARSALRPRGPDPGR